MDASKFVDELQLVETELEGEYIGGISEGEPPTIQCSGAYCNSVIREGQFAFLVVGIIDESIEIQSCGCRECGPILVNRHTVDLLIVVGCVLQNNKLEDEIEYLSGHHVQPVGLEQR